MKNSKIKEMSSPELEKELSELKSELFKLRFSLATNGLDNPLKVKEEQVIGTIVFPIPRVGYPSVWLYELLN